MGRAKDILDTAHHNYLAQRMEQTITQACGFCDWTVTGPFGETRLLAEAHRRSIHPNAKQRTRLIRSRAGIRAIGTKTLEENVAGVRYQGGAAWSSVDGAMEA